MLPKPFVTRATRALILTGLAIAIAPAAALAQQSAAPVEHVHPTPPPEAAAGQEHQHGAGGASLFLLRESSGTAWQPEATPMRGFMPQVGGWAVMLHGNAFVQYLHESAPEHRGGSEAGSINWAMLMARRPMGAARFGLRMMASLEPWTIPGCGYPNLLQTGESCDGDTLHDQQHPHDVFMELAAEFERPLASSWQWHLYGGLAGEPALGPPAFPHRASAMSNPLSPIVHHWSDATHISFGVVTTGVSRGRWKAEMSAFNGREPDEARHDIDLAPLDSVAARVSVLPTSRLAVQVSAGRLNDAEPGHPDSPAIDLVRATASVSYHRPMSAGGLWATTLLWGANREEGETTHGVMVESSLDLSGRDVLFGRAEVNGKSAHDLHIHDASGVFTVGKAQAGYTRYLAPRRGLQPGLGASLSAAVVPAALQPRYGGVGVGAGVFLTVRSAVHQMTP